MKRLFQRKRRTPAPTSRRIAMQSVEALESRRLLVATADFGLAEPVVQPPTALVATPDTADVTARIVNGNPTTEFQAVGIVNDGCSGTLVSPTHVLTAAHCVESFNGFIGDREGTFEVDGQVLRTVKVTPHPEYDSNRFDVGFDIAIMELERPVANVDWIPINRDTPQVGQMLTLVGFGEGGTTANPIFDFGVKRVGQTPIDEVTQNHIIWNFDSAAESNTAPGDSGGPAFLTTDGQLYVAGVTSGGDGDPHSLGDRSFDTRVDTLASWIDSIVGDAPAPPTPDPVPPPPNPTPDPDPVPPPAPPTDPAPDTDLHADRVGPDATPIALEDGVFGYVDATINDASDRDVFQVTLTRPGTVYVDLFSYDGQLDTQLQVFDADGLIVSDNNDSYGGTDSSLILELEAGNYYLMASAFDSASQGEYGLDVFVDDLGGFAGGLLDDSGDADLTPPPDGTIADSSWDVPGGFDWTNDIAPWDVNDDGFASPFDALLVINHLNSSGSGNLDPREADSTAPYLDVNGDSFATPSDALLVLNHLNRASADTLSSAKPRIVNGTPTTDYEAVGIVNGGCTGTLISSTHVLTAAHCVESSRGFIGDQEGTFEVAGSNFTTVKVTPHPSYDSSQFDLGFDLAIMELAQPVSSVSPAAILRDAPQVGQMLTLVGFGEGGTTSNPIFDFGTKRVGQTPIDEITQHHIVWHFDSANESNTAPGDSGGPAFVTIDGLLYVAGVTSGGDGDPHSLGDRSFDTRVDTLAAWIDDVVGGTTPNPTPDPTPTPNPTPDPNPDPGPAPQPGPGDDLVADVHVDDIGSAATPIVLEGGVFGYIDAAINTNEDCDVFQVTLTSPGRVYIDLYGYDLSLDTALQVFDTDGAIVSDNNDSYGTTDSSLTLELEAGTYYLVASSHDGLSRGEYGLDVYVSTMDAAGVNDEWFGEGTSEIPELPQDAGADDGWALEDDADFWWVEDDPGTWMEFGQDEVAVWEGDDGEDWWW